MLRIAAFICLLFASLSYAQVGPAPGLVGCTFAYFGPGDTLTYTVWGGLRAYSRQTCGLPVAYVCDTTGGVVDVACADMVTSVTTGKLVPKMIGGLNCGDPTEVSGLCKAKIIYNTAPLNATCTVRGVNGTPGTCDAVQNTIANRYGLYGPDGIGCNALAFACMFSSAASAGYALNSSITLTQPFAMYAVAYTVNTSSTNTFLGVGNSNIHFSTGSAGNILYACDSGSGTAASQYVNFFPPGPQSMLITCEGTVASIYQGALGPFTQVTGGSSTATGTPTIMAGGGSPLNFWEYGILAVGPKFTETMPNTNSCNFYGLKCSYAFSGDVVSFKAYWGLRAYKYSTMGTPLQSTSFRIINACSAGDASCGDIGTFPYYGNIAIPTLGGEFGQSCFAPITSGTYNNTTGAGSLAIDTPFNQTQMVSGNRFALGTMSGTNATLLEGAQVATTGTTNMAGSTTGTINFTGPTGMGITVTGGTVSTCTIKVFYDISGQNFCTGGVPCNQTQNTIANRAILTVDCVRAGRECATFNGSTFYTGPGTDSTSLPYSGMFIADRTAGTGQQMVIDCGCAYGFHNVASEVFAYDGNTAVAAGAATDGLFHMVVGTNDVSNTILYVDGSLSASVASSGGGMTQPYYLGAHSGASQFVSGRFLEGGMTNSAIVSTDQNTLYLSNKRFWGWP